MNGMADINLRIAAAFNYLQEALGSPNGSKVAVRTLAVELNKGDVSGQLFKAHKIYQFKSGTYVPPENIQEEWRRRIEEFSRSKGLQASSLEKLSDQFLARYGKPSKISTPVRNEFLFAGDHIDHPDILCGAWRFFYISPVDRQSDPKPEIRGVLAIFRKTDDAQNRVSVQMISGSTHWVGYAFSFELHLYIVCTAEQKTETAFFVVNKPNRTQRQFVAGLGTALERGDTLMHPAMGVICCGEKVFPRIDLAEAQYEQTLSEGLGASLERLIAGEFISSEDDQIIREHFKVTYKNLKIFADHHPHLHDYLRKHIRLRKKPISMQSLLLQWV